MIFCIIVSFYHNLFYMQIQSLVALIKTMVKDFHLSALIPIIDKDLVSSLLFYFVKRVFLSHVLHVFLYLTTMFTTLYGYYSSAWFAIYSCL